MKQINEQVSRIRKMMGLKENVNEFFSMPGEREGLPEPVDETNDIDGLPKHKVIAQYMGKNHHLAQKNVDDWTPDDHKLFNHISNMAATTGKVPGYGKPRNPVDEDELTGKQKDLAALAEPKDKITGADFAALRHGAKMDEEGGKKDYSKLEAALQKEGSRKVAIRLVDALIYKFTQNTLTASDLPDTATYANGLDTIEELLDVQDYQGAYSQAKETASDMLEEEGYSDFLDPNHLGEKELSDKQKDIAAQAPPYDKITGADFKALQSKKDLDEEWDGSIDPTYTHFAVSNDDNKIVNGWEYEPDTDAQSIKHYCKIDLNDMEIDPKTVKIYTKKTLNKMGINPFDPQNWKNIHSSVSESDDLFSYGDEQQDPDGGRLPNYNRELIKKYVDAIEKRARVKKVGVTPNDLMQRFNDMDDMPSRPDIEMIMYTLSKKGLLFSDPAYKNKIEPQNVNQYLEFTDPDTHTDTEKLTLKALDRNMNEKVTLTKENMFNALSEAKKKGKVNPWAVCTASVGRESDKYEKCVKDVKKKQGIKK